MEYGESGRNTGARRRTIELPGSITDVLCSSKPSDVRSRGPAIDRRRGETTPGIGVGEAELFVGDCGDECADFSEFGSRTWFHDQPEVCSVDEHKAVAPEGRVDSNGPMPGTSRVASGDQRTMGG